MEQAVVSALSEFGDTLIGLFVAGSVGKGCATPTSDIDLHVIFAGAWLQRRRRVIENILVDIFIDTKAHLDAQLRNSGDPILVRNVSEGFIISDPTGILEASKLIATRLLQGLRAEPNGPQIFMHVNRLQDALANVLVALDKHDDLVASHQLCFLISYGFEAYFCLARRWRPASKLLVLEIEREHPQIAEAFKGLLDPLRPLSTKGALAEMMTRLVIGKYERNPAASVAPKSSDQAGFAQLHFGDRIVKVPRIR